MIYDIHTIKNTIYAYISTFNTINLLYSHKYDKLCIGTDKYQKSI